MMLGDGLGLGLGLGQQCLVEQIVEASYLVLGDVTAIVEDEEQWVFELGLHDTLQGPWLTLVGFEYPIPVSTGTDADVDAVEGR